MSPTDSDNTETPGSSILDSKVTESSTSTWDNDPVTLLCLGVLDGAIDRDTLNHVKFFSSLGDVVVAGNLK